MCIFISICIFIIIFRFVFLFLFIFICMFIFIHIHLAQEKKNPTDFDIQSRVDLMGTDHHSLQSDEFFGGSLGLEPAALKGLDLPSQFAKSSAPSNPEARAKLEEQAKVIEDAKFAKKEASKIATKAKLANKSYDRARLTTLEPLIKAWGTDAFDKAQQMLVKAAGVLQMVEHEEELKNNFSSGHETLTFRLKALTSLIGQEGHSALESRDAVKVWLAEPGTQSAILKGVKTDEPHKNIVSLPTFAECKEALESFDPTSLDEEKNLKKALRAKLDSFLSMVTRVSEQTSRLAFAIKRFNERADTKAEKEEEEAAAAQAESARAMGQKARMAKQVAETQKKEAYNIFKHVTAMKPMRRIKETEEWNDYKYQDQPVIMQDPIAEECCTKFLKSQETVDFKKLAEGSAKFRVSGRVAQQLDSLDPDIKSHTDKYHHVHHNFVVGMLSNAEKEYLEMPWVFVNSGSMQSRGAEFSYLPTLKYQLAGSRVVLACDFGLLLAYVKTTVPGNTALTYDQIVDFFAEADRNVMLFCMRALCYCVGRS